MKAFILSHKKFCIALFVIFILILGCFVWFHPHIGINNLPLHKISDTVEFDRTKENEMEQINFKCKACNSYHEMRKKFPTGFSGWAYSNMEWSDFEEEVPSLSEKYWEHSDSVPKTGEFRIVKVQTPFDEKIGDEFYMEFVPEYVFFNGYDDVEQIRDSAIVQCKLEEVIVADEYSGWIKVKVLKVILLSELFEEYSPFPTDCKLEEYAGTCECDEKDPELVDTSWEIKFWTGQGDIGEWKIIYTDTNGFRHLILMNFYSWFDDVTYFGNIVEIK